MGMGMMPAKPSLKVWLIAGEPKGVRREIKHENGHRQAWQTVQRNLTSAL
jgi:hypothetical protein